LALSASLNQAQQDNMNAVPLYDDYNEYLVTYYQQAVVGIQAAFTMESLVNQLNYYNAGQNAPIDSLGLVPGTYYSFQDLQTALGSKPSATAQGQYYNRAQQALAQLYAARVNQLYQDTISYIVTDDPVGSQAWPSSATGNRVNANIDYASNVGTQVTSDSAAGGPKESTPLALLPPAATKGAQWTSNAVLYQYFGLRNAGTCYANLLQWNKDNGTAVQGKNGTWYPTATPSQSELAGGAYDRQCPPILTTSTGTAVTAPPTSSTLNSCAAYAVLPGVQGGSGSCYDGNTLVPYYAAAGGLPELGSAVLTNLLLCNASDPALTWFQVGSANAGNAAGLTLGDWALTCGNWAAPAGPGYANGAGAFPGSSPPTSWAISSELTCGPVSISGNQSYSAYQNAASPNCINGANATSIWGAAGYGVNQFTFNSFYVPGYYVSPNWVGLGGGGSPPAYIPPATATMGEYQAPLNIGGGSGNVNVTIDSSNCYSDSWSTGASVSGCAISFAQQSGGTQSFGQDNLWRVAPAGLAAFAVSLPNGGTGGAGGFSLPILVGTSVYSSGSTFISNEIVNWLEVWVNSGTSISQVGYYAPPSVPVPNGYLTGAIWQQNGYITVADGSCWNINLGRTANNVGTISFNQITPGSLCASAVTSPVTATAPLPVITAASPPSSGTVGTAYGPYTFTASGSPAPTWSVASGALPAGVTLSSAGVLSGTPTTGGSSTFTVQATNTAGSATSGSITITVTATAPVITAASPPSSGTVGAAYGPYTFTASGSPAPTWSVASGALPAGVTLSSAGVLSGTPTTGGSSTFTVQATNTAGSATSGSITIVALASGGVL
jgi:hypothetical protein